MNLADLISQADPANLGTASLFGYGFLASLPPVPPRCGHYNAAAPGIAGLLGQVDENLIRDAMAEKAAGVTLH